MGRPFKNLSKKKEDDPNCDDECTRQKKLDAAKENNQKRPKEVSNLLLKVLRKLYSKKTLQWI